MQTKNTTTKQKTRKSKKARGPKLSAKQKARLKQIEADAATNLAATTNFLEELTEDCFLRTAIDNEIVAQCKHYGITPVRYRDDRTQFFSALNAIFNFGPAIDEVRASEAGPPSIKRISEDDLIALTDRIGSTQLFVDREAAMLFCGLLHYFERLSRSAEASYLDDDIFAVTQRIFHQSLIGSDSANKFADQAYDSLRDNLKALTTPEN